VAANIYCKCHQALLVADFSDCHWFCAYLHSPIIGTSAAEKRRANVGARTTKARLHQMRNGRCAHICAKVEKMMRNVQHASNKPPNTLNNTQNSEKNLETHTLVEQFAGNWRIGPVRL
jgi:hypothetical protein